jgi:hypothetical protein
MRRGTIFATFPLLMAAETSPFFIKDRAREQALT